MSIPNKTKIATNLLIPQYEWYVVYNDDDLNRSMPVLRDFMA